MIHFEIVSGPEEALATFKFHKNEVYLGRNPLDLAIPDPGLLENHILLEIPENELLVHPQKGVEFYLLNGKRATSIRKIKPGDLLSVGTTTIKILEYARSDFPTKKEILDQKLAQLLENGSSRLPVIEKLTKMMK